MIKKLNDIHQNNDNINGETKIKKIFSRIPFNILDISAPYYLTKLESGYKKTEAWNNESRV